MRPRWNSATRSQTDERDRADATTAGWSCLLLQRMDQIEELARRLRIEAAVGSSRIAIARPSSGSRRSPDVGACARIAVHRLAAAASSRTASAPRRCARRPRQASCRTALRCSAYWRRREVVVEADRIRHVADAALDLERLTQRIKAATTARPRSARSGRAASGSLSSCRRRSARAGRHLARLDRKIEAVDRERRTVALGQRLGANDRFAHRRRTGRPRPPAPAARSG